MNLSDVLAGGVAPLADVAAWAAHLPPESAVGQALDPYVSERSTTNELLRAVEHRLRVLAWIETRNPRSPTPPPEPLRFPWDPPREGGWRGDSLDWDMAVEALGNDPRFAAVMARLT